MFESVNPDTLAITDIALSGFTHNEVNGMTYEEPGNLLLVDRSSKLTRVTTGGVSSLIGTLDHRSKGLAFAKVSNQPVNDNATIRPFAEQRIEDDDFPSDTLTVTVALDNAANGALSNLGGFADQTGGVYSFSGTAADATTAMQGLIFDPTDGRVAKGFTETTTFMVTLDDAVADPVVDGNTSVTATSVDGAPFFVNRPLAEVAGIGANLLYEYPITVSDLDGLDTLVITGTTVPAFLTLTDNTDRTADLEGTPTNDDVGDHTVDLLVTNTTTGKSNTQSFTLTVAATNHPPTIRNDLNLYSATRDDDTLYLIDPAAGSTISSVTVSVEGGGTTVFHANGLTTNPFTGELWAILATACEHCTSGRSLGVIDPDTGDATIIGSTFDAFAGIAFDDRGRLFGVTGDGADWEDLLFTMDPQTGGRSLYMEPYDASGGETIGYNPNDGLIYHGAGSRFESIDLARRTTTFISNTFEIHSALTYRGNGPFFAAVSDDFFRVRTDGIRSTIFDLDHDSKGLAFTGIGEPRQSVTDITTIKPFTKVSIRDIDLPQQILEVCVSLDDPDKGVLTDLGGFLNQGGGVYCINGTPSFATMAIQGLTFDPTENRVPPGQSETTTFTISADDGIAPVTAIPTKVKSTSVADKPTIQREPGLFSGDRSDPILRVIDPSDGSTIKAVDVTTNVRTETFDTDSGALSIAKGVNTDGFDIGWSNSNNSGGDSGGEFGGIFARTNDASTHYFADTNIGTITRSDRIHISGKFVITGHNNADLRIQVGFINTTTADANPFSFSQNQIGMVILEPGDEPNSFRALSHSNTPTLSDLRGAERNVPIGSVTAFNYIYTPSGQADGNGSAVLTLTLGDGTVLESKLNESRGPDPADFEFDAFIIGGAALISADPSSTATVFFDDISYTVNAGIVDTVEKLDGLGTNPLTGELFAIVTLDGRNNERRLATLDPVAGTVGIIGSTGTKITGLAFDNTGMLYGVTGGGANPSETLVNISEDSGIPITHTMLGNGGSGETIGFNPNDGMMYHGSGEVFESLDLVTQTITPISSSFSNITALTDDREDGFLAAQFDEFSHLTTSGVQTIRGNMDHASNSFAFNRYDGSGQQIFDYETNTPFADVTIGHTAETPPGVTVMVNLDDALKGGLSSPGVAAFAAGGGEAAPAGFSDDGGGVYSFTGSVADATAALRSLVFTPAPFRAPLGSTETAGFTIEVDDGSAPIVMDTTTSVVTTAVLESYDDWVIRLFGDDAGNPLKSGKAVDFSGDGVVNLVAYALGLDPIVLSGDGLPALNVNEAGDAFELAFRRSKSAANIDYLVEKSINLSDWETVDESPSILQEEATFWILQEAISLGVDDTFFVRLRIRDPQ